jgi:hypothetical protein
MLNMRVVRKHAWEGIDYVYVRMSEAETWVLYWNTER